MSLNIELIEFSDVKEHYSSDISLTILRRTSLGNTVIFIAPPGTGKTYAISSLSVRTISGRGLTRTLSLRYVPSVLITSPTHTTLDSVSRKIIQSFTEAYSQGMFSLVKPRVFILRGSIYSCINEEIKNSFHEIVRQIQQVIGDINLLLELYDRLQSRELAHLPEREVRRTVDTLLEYSFYGEIELSFAPFCRACTLRRGITEELVRKILETDLDPPIIDTESSRAEQMLTKLIDEEAITTRVCLYKLIIRAIALGEAPRDKPYIACCTHAVYCNPLLCELEAKRYQLVTHRGYRARQVAFIDEVDYILNSPPSVKIPPQLDPDFTISITPDRVRRTATKYTLSSNRRALETLVRRANQLYREIKERFTSRTTDPFDIVRAVKNFLEICVQDQDTLKRARTFLKTWADNLFGKSIKEGTIDPDDLAVYSICSKFVDALYFAEIFELHRLIDELLARRLKIGLVTIAEGDERGAFVLEADRRFGHVIVRYMAGIEIPLLEHAVRLALDPDYPIPYTVKVGTTATFSESYLYRVIDSLSDLYRTDILSEHKISRISILYSDITYINIHYYIACTQVPGRLYSLLARDELDTDQVSLLLSEVESRILMLSETDRKTLFREESTYIPGTTFAGEVMLNLIHEIYFALMECIGEIPRRRLSRNGTPIIKAVVFVGTRPQLIEIVYACNNMMNMCIEHGLLTICIDDVTETDLSYVYRVRATVTVRENGTRFRIELLLGHARGVLSRGVDLEEYDIAVLLTPPLSIPTTVYEIVTGDVEDNVIRATIAVEQAVSRIVRRVIYREPKIIMLDSSLVAQRYLRNYSVTFRSRIEEALRTSYSPILRKMEELQEEAP